MCEKFGLYGYSGWDGGGGMSEFVVVPPKNVHVVPDNISLDLAALVEREWFRPCLASKQQVFAAVVALLVHITDCLSETSTDSSLASHKSGQFQSRPERLGAGSR